MGFSGTCAWRYLVDHFQAPFSHFSTMVDVDPPAASLVWQELPPEAPNQSIPAKAAWKKFEHQHDCVCFFYGMFFCNKKVGFSRQVFINMKHVMLHVSAVFCWVLSLCLLYFVWSMHKNGLMWSHVFCCRFEPTCRSQKWSNDGRKSLGWLRCSCCGCGTLVDEICQSWWSLLGCGHEIRYSFVV